MSEIPKGWQRDRFDNFIILKRGYDLPTSQRNSGKVPLVAASGIIDVHDSAMVKAPGIVTGRSGTIGNVSYIETDFWPLNTTLYVQKFKNNHPKFIYYFLQHFKLERFSYGTSVPTLNRNEVHPVKINIPPIEEQRAIADILGTWDEAIALTESLISALEVRKKGLMQKLLTGEVRFSEFDGEWEIKNFEEVFKRVTRKNIVGNDNPLTISAQYGLINQRDFFNKRVASKNLEGYYLLKNGEFAYNKSYSDGYPFGAIKRLDNYEAGALSTLYICFKLIGELNDSDFFNHYFDAGRMNKEIYQIAQEGARNHGLLNMSIGDFFKMDIDLPNPEEQSKIASLLNTQDTIISNIKQQRDALQQQKKGLMQQLLTGQVRVRVGN